MCPLGVHNLFVKHDPVCPLRSYRGMFIQCLPLWGYKSLMSTIVGDAVWNLELALVLVYPLGTLSLKSWRAVSAIIERASIIWLRRPWISMQVNTALFCSYRASELCLLCCQTCVWQTRLAGLIEFTWLLGLQTAQCSTSKYNIWVG